MHLRIDVNTGMFHVKQPNQNRRRNLSTTSHYAVFVDLENAGAKESMLNSIIEKVKIRGDILLGKVYGYTDRYSELKEVLLSNTFYVVPSLRYGHNQKNNLDIQLVIDALEVAFNNDLIDSFCIVSGDSDYTPLVGKLKSMGKHVLGISRSEVASSIFIKACNEFIFLESVSSATKAPALERVSEPSDELAEMCALMETVLSDQDEDMMYASELKSTLLRLRPDFNEGNYGCSTFGKFLQLVSQRNSNIRIVNDNHSVLVGLQKASADEGAPKLTKASWMHVFARHLQRFKSDGFDRINPSILKSAIQGEYPDFDERTIGFKRFSDMLKRMERERLVEIEMDEQHTMLIKIC